VLLLSRLLHLEGLESVVLETRGREAIEAPDLSQRTTMQRPGFPL
jgi:hypothetical protein